MHRRSLLKATAGAAAVLGAPRLYAQAWHNKSHARVGTGVGVGGGASTPNSISREVSF